MGREKKKKKKKKEKKKKKKVTSRVLRSQAKNKINKTEKTSSL